MTDPKNDIEKYLKGELTPAEMHALEKKALTDPFLADALEGLETIPKDVIANELKSLHVAIQQRTVETKKIIPLWGWTWRIAAGLMLIAISTYFIITLSDHEAKSNLALNAPASEPVQPNTKVKEAEDVTAEQPKAAAVQPSVVERKVESEPRTFRAENKKQKQDEPVYEESVPAEAEGSAPASIEMSPGDYAPITDSIRVAQGVSTYGYSTSKPEEVNDDKDKVNLITGAAINKSVASAKADVRNQKIIKGRVTDAEDGTGMPGVNIIVKGTNAATTTDINGNYEIAVDNPQADLVFSFIGYSNQEVPADNKDNIEVGMTTDYAALSEVVVVGYASLRAELEDPTNVYTYAEPKGGRKAYRNYLVQNMHYPEQAIEHNVEGKVTVQFAIESDGMIDEFKVLKTPGYGCDDEVVRLIKEGPKWSPSTRNNVPIKGKVKVRLKFTLQK
jgi:TonB family protein